MRRAVPPGGIIFASKELSGRDIAASERGAVRETWKAIELNKSQPFHFGLLPTSYFVSFEVAPSIGWKRRRILFVTPSSH